MIASRIGRAGTRFGPTRFGGSKSPRIGSISAHSSSDTRQIGGNASRSRFRPTILHLLLSRRCSPHASLEIASKERIYEIFRTYVGNHCADPSYWLDPT